MLCSGVAEQWFPQLSNDRPSLWGDGKSGLLSFMGQPVKTFWYVQYWAKDLPTNVNTELWNLCSQSGKGTLFAAMPRSVIVLYPWDYPRSNAIGFWDNLRNIAMLWSWSRSWPSFFKQLFISLTYMRAVGIQRKLWLQLCKLEKEKGQMPKEGGEKLNTLSLPTSPQIFLELFVFLIVFSQNGKKRPQLQEELGISRHFIPAELMMLF